MKFILIVMWYGYSTSIAGKAALDVEFNSMQACQAAAKEIKRQERESAKIGTLICAEKGYAE